MTTSLSTLTTSLTCRVALSKATVRALRLLCAQLKLLKLDAANAHLRMLSVSMGSGGAVQCAFI